MNRPLSNAEKENAPAATASEAHEENHMTNCETTKTEDAGCASLPIEFSIFPDTSATQVKQHRATWGEIVKVLQSPNAHPSKHQCPLIKLATFGDKRTDKGALRHDDNLLSIYGVEGDYDGEEVSVERAGDMLAIHGVEATAVRLNEGANR